jgi:HlyD family secretion protein
MKTWQKVSIGVAGVAIAAGIVGFSVSQANKDVVTVQTARVGKQRVVSVVTASGEIRPRTYSNVLAEGMGRITDIYVKEGDHVNKGDVLMQVDLVQPRADVAAQSAGQSSAQAAADAAEAAFRQAQADLNTQKANLDNATQNWKRGQDLFKDGIIPAQQYDQYKSAYDGSIATVASATAHLAQTKAQVSQAQFALMQTKETLVHLQDVLNKTTYRAPIPGVVSYIAMRVGEDVVPGIQNSSGSYLMTISDMSIVTSETMVDETDIINLRTGQKAQVTIDALPGQTFSGVVTEVGSQAVLRSSGLATTQTTTGSQEARDFKVVVTLDQPPVSLRPGLSCTSKVTTAERQGVLAIPIQALTMRSRKDLEEAKKQAAAKGGGDSSVTLAAAPDDPNKNPALAAENAAKPDIQGVFVVRNGKVMFIQVKTGISGVTDIEITDGIKEGDEIVTGSYKALRTLRPDAPVKIDNKPKDLKEAGTS